jgi:hypothetical protein
VNVNAGNDGKLIDVPVGFEKPNSSYTSVVICEVEASRMLRPDDASEITFALAGGAEVIAVKESVVLGGSETAAGSANVPDAPPTDGTATD